MVNRIKGPGAQPPAVGQAPAAAGKQAQPAAQKKAAKGKAPSAQGSRAQEADLSELPNLGGARIEHGEHERLETTRLGATYLQPPPTSDLQGGAGGAYFGSGGLTGKSDSASGGVNNGYGYVDVGEYGGQQATFSLTPDFVKVGVTTPLDDAKLTTSLGGFPGGAFGPSMLAKFDTANGPAVAGAYLWFGAGSKLWIEAPPEDAKPDTPLRVAYTRSMDAGAVAVGGFRPMALGFGASFAVTGDKQVQFQTTVPYEETQKLRDYRDQRLTFFRNHAANISEKARPVRVPDVSQPLESMRPGDLLRTSLKGSLTVGVAVDAAARVGVHASISGDWHVAVARVDEHRVKVAVAPHVGKTYTADIQLPFLVRGSLSHEGAKALHQEFTFDLSTASGKAAYQKFVDHGELPRPLIGRTEKLSDPGTAMLERYQAEQLPEGVERGVSERVHQSGHRKAIDFGPVLAPLHFSTGRSEQQRVVSDGHVSYTEDGVTRDRTKSLFFHTRKKDEFSAVIGKTSRLGESAPAHQFEHLALEATFFRKDASASNRDSIAAKLGRSFGVDVPAQYPQIRAMKGEFSVSVERKIAAGELFGMEFERAAAQIGKISAETKIPERELTAALAQACRAPPPGPEATSSDVEAAARKRAEPLQMLVKKHGIDGLAAIHQLLPPNAEAVHISFDGSKTAKLQHKAQEFLRPGAPALSKGERKQVTELRAKLRNHVIKLMADPMRAAVHKEKTEAQCDLLVDLDLALKDLLDPPQKPAEKPSAPPAAPSGASPAEKPSAPTALKSGAPPPPESSASPAEKPSASPVEKPSASPAEKPNAPPTMSPVKQEVAKPSGGSVP